MKKLKILLFFFILIQNFVASAHPLDIGILDIENRGNEVNLKLELNPFAAQRISENEKLFSQTIGQSSLIIQGKPCVWRKKHSVTLTSPETVSLTGTADCPELVHHIELKLDFLKKMETSFNLVVKTRLNGNERVFSLNPSENFLKVTVNELEKQKTFFDFVAQGISHIGLSKDQWMENGHLSFPPGIDHILFLIALMLSGGVFIELLKMVTGFTLGHTISVTLAAFHFMNVPGEWVEPIIALTIVLVSLDSLAKFNFHKKWKITLFIGLIHGLAFAEALVDLNLGAFHMIQAVLGFNLGVEMAQGILIALLFPIVYQLRKSFFAKKYALPALSLFIALLGTYWFIDRLVL